MFYQSSGFFKSHALAEAKRKAARNAIKIPFREKFRLPLTRIAYTGGNQMTMPDHFRGRLFWGLNALLGVIFLIELLVPRWLSWVDAAAFVVMAVTALVALARQLPVQNVLMVGGITALIGGVAHGISAKTAIPFGPVVFNSTLGWKISGLLPWTVPFVWIAILFTARGVARLILRPWRKVKVYGYWLIALTALLATAFDVALEPYVWHVKHLWLWEPTKLAMDWHGVPLLNFLSWECVSLLILMFITPSLIRKQPGGGSKPDLHPFFVWSGALLVFAVGSAGAGMWWAAGVDVLIAGVTGWFAVRGAKW